MGRIGTLSCASLMRAYMLPKTFDARCEDPDEYLEALIPEVPRTLDGPCQRPVLMWDTWESRPFFVRCKQAGSLCPSCSKGRRREVRRVAHTGVLTQMRLGKFFALVTVLAPGDPGHRRWDVRGPRRDRPVCGCEHAMGNGIAFWNGEAGSRWNHLRTALAREYPGFEFFRGVEPQDGKRKLGRGRMALHFHVLIASDNPLDPAVVQRFALAAGFGCNVRVDQIDNSPEGARAAAYATKYVTKCADTRSEVPWEVVDPETGELVGKRATYRAWSQSKHFGCRMKEHRAAVAAQRRIHAERLREVAHDQAVALVLDVLGAVVLEPAPD